MSLITVLKSFENTLLHTIKNKIETNPQLIYNITNKSSTFMNIYDTDFYVTSVKPHTNIVLPSKTYVILYNNTTSKWFDNITDRKYFNNLFNDTIYSGIYLVDYRFIDEFIPNIKGIIFPHFIYMMIKYGYINNYFINV